MQFKEKKKQFIFLKPVHVGFFCFLADCNKNESFHQNYLFKRYESVAKFTNNNSFFTKFLQKMCVKIHGCTTDVCPKDSSYLDENNKHKFKF